MMQHIGVGAKQEYISSLEFRVGVMILFACETIIHEVRGPTFMLCYGGFTGEGVEVVF